MLARDVFRVLCILSPFIFCAYGVNTLSRLEKPIFEAMYQFGDSIADAGNRVREFPHYSCGRPPYGQTFFHHPTGGCSDGLLIIDFFGMIFILLPVSSSLSHVITAKALNLPFLDPYLDKNGNFTHGVNFAVAGATALNVSTLAAKNITANVSSSLLVQPDWFKSHLNSMCFTPSECKEKLGKALFFAGEIGGNDYNFAAYQGKTMEHLQALVPEVIQTIMHVVKELIDVGARRIIVPGNFPVGCMTVYLAKFKTDDTKMYDELNCLRRWNEFAMFQNDQLQTAIQDLQERLPDVAIVYADYYTALTSILSRATSLGFEEDGLQKACCGTGNNDQYNFDSSKMCGYHGVSVCPDPNKRVSWDGIHLTQHAYQLVADWLLQYILPTNSKVQVA
ncbi:hypothetical protein Cgig2_023350 [Carnegiea gigantea]|uniref:Uncharacterized protein n=1 Tax=Carnegiea gigantea TaxID=171969 RepID=A0A9Q1JN89_9CARY|nr:hypothetical protein Cgig2_023350 [Carnegiea gigantea]